MDGRSGGLCKSPDEPSFLPCSTTWICQPAASQNSGSKSPPGHFQPDVVITGQRSNVLQDWNADNMTDKGGWGGGGGKARSSVLAQRGYSLVYIYSPEGEMIHDKMSDLSIKPGNSRWIKWELTDYPQPKGRMYDPSTLSLISSFFFAVLVETF